MARSRSAAKAAKPREWVPFRNVRVLSKGTAPGRTESYTLVDADADPKIVALRVDVPVADVVLEDGSAPTAEYVGDLLVRVGSAEALAGEKLSRVESDAPTTSDATAPPDAEA